MKNDERVEQEAAGSQDATAWWLGGGRFFCDAHRQQTHRGGIPFFYAPADAKCAVCSDDATESYLTRRQL